MCCWPGPVSAVSYIFTAIDNGFDDDDCSVLMVLCCCCWAPIALVVVFLFLGMEPVYLLVILFAFIIASAIESCQECARDRERQKKARETAERKRKEAEKKRKEEEEKKELIAARERKVKADLEKVEFSKDMSIENLVRKITVLEYKRNSEEKQTLSAIKTLRDRWICFAGDLAAHGFSELKIEPFLQARLEEVIKEECYENGIKPRYVTPEIDFSGRTGVKEFLSRICKAHGFPENHLISSTNQLAANMIKTVAELVPMISVDDDTTLRVRREMFPPIVLQAKLWGYLNSGQGGGIVVDEVKHDKDDHIIDVLNPE